MEGGNIEYLKLENTKEELITIVDSDDNIIGNSNRIEMRRNNLPHRSSSIFIFNPETRKFAIQKRSSNKEYFPSYFDLTTGGVLGANEDINNSAHRELYEEMGVKLSNENELVFVGKHFTSDEFSQAWHYIYFLNYSGSFFLNDGEVDYIEFWCKEEIENNIKQNAKITPDSIKCYLYLVKNKLI